MAKTNEKVEDFSEVLQELHGLVKDNYMLGFEALATLIEENKKFIDSQYEQFFALQKELLETTKAACDGLTKGFAEFPIAANIDRLTKIQEDNVALLQNLIDRFSRNTLNLTQKATENAFKVFEDYAKIFNV